MGPTPPFSQTPYKYPRHPPSLPLPQLFGSFSPTLNPVQSNQNKPTPCQSKPIKAHPELANPNQTQTQPEPNPTLEGKTQPEPEGEPNKWAVQSLYEALNHRDVDRVHQLLAPDLEWWFHGPPVHQHMMRLLTGAAADDETFEFVPISIESIGSTVLVEGSDRTQSVYWVHAWTVDPDHGIITQVREYFNTSVTVTRFGGKRSASCCLLVWQSKLPDRAGKSLPGLVLAIQ